MPGPPPAERVQLLATARITPGCYIFLVRVSISRLGIGVVQPGPRSGDDKRAAAFRRERDFPAALGAWGRARPSHRGVLRRAACFPAVTISFNLKPRRRAGRRGGGDREEAPA